MKLDTSLQVLTKVFLSFALLWGISGLVFAQPAVVELGQGQAAQRNTTPSVADAPAVDASQTSVAPAAQADTAVPGDSGNNNIVMTLYNQLEAMQREVQTLRGMVDEQSHQIQSMQQDQRDRYLDIDNRLSELMRQVNQNNNGTVPLAGPGVDDGNGLPVETGSPGSTADLSGSSTRPETAGSVSAPQTVSGARTVPVPPTGAIAGNAGIQRATPAASADTPPAGPDTTALPTPQTEQESYRQALNLLLEQGDYEAAVTRFQAHIDQYPDGRFTPNAYYWLGEALILVNRYNQAINVFNKVIEDYPMHDKAPDAMLKLGVVYYLMNNTQRADEIWRDLLDRYADSGSAALRLAEGYLRDGYTR